METEDMITRLCEERHQEIKEKMKNHDDKLKEHDGSLDKHSSEISDLRRDSAVNDARIEQLTKSLASLTKALWGLAVAIGMTLIGFMFWVLQQAITHAMGG